MGNRNAVLRAIVAGALLSTCLSAGTAVAQTTPQDTGLTLTQITDQTLDVTSSTSIDFGGTADYAITVTNTGPNLATNVQLSKVALPAAPAATSVL
ncbi:MAG TPA: hypothetical protein VF341_12565, partial [Anaeromyxobacteraceae bacterium]